MCTKRVRNYFELCVLKIADFDLINVDPLKRTKGEGDAQELVHFHRADVGTSHNDEYDHHRRPLFCY